MGVGKPPLHWNELNASNMTAQGSEAPLRADCRQNAYVTLPAAMPAR
jgi:hypothetical protein